MAEICSKLWIFCRAVVLVPAAMGMTMSTSSGKRGRQREGHQAARGPSDDRVQPLDAKVPQEPYLGIDHVGKSHAGKRRSVRLAGRGVDGRRPGGSITAPEVVRRDDEELGGVEGFARPDESVPPPDLAFVVPYHLEAGWAYQIETGGVLAPTESVKQQDGVGAIRVQLAVRLVGNGDLVEDAAGPQHERVVRRPEGEQTGFYIADAVSGHVWLHYGNAKG